MTIYGLDFTSRPSNRKPITCVFGHFDGAFLNLEGIELFSSFAEFEAFLVRPGPWRAGFDFPFGQPRKLLMNLGLKGDWGEIVSWFERLGRAGFEKQLRDYWSARPEGDKHHRRKTDVFAGACSPMMLDFTPVAKMFFEGAPRLLRSRISILPVKRCNDNRVAIEAYPKLVAQRYGHGKPYKAEKQNRLNAAQAEARGRILAGLDAGSYQDFGFHLRLSGPLRNQAVADPTGDILDALLAAVQAGWSARQQQPPDGIPVTCDSVEGWIVDPSLIGNKIGQEPVPLADRHVDARQFEIQQGWSLSD